MSQKLSKTLIIACCATAIGMSGAMTNLASAYEKPVYDQAVAAISDYDKVEALSAAVYAVDAQLPDFAPYYNMSPAPSEISGKTCGEFDYRLGGYTGCGLDLITRLAFDLGTAEGTITTPIDDFISDPHLPTEYEGKTLNELITMAKSASSYATDTTLQESVARAESVYNRGLASLRTNLPLVDDTLTGLDTKTGAELVAIYEALPAVKDKTYDELISSYHQAITLLAMVEYGSEGITADDFISAYGELVASAKAIDPKFSVDLTDVARLAAAAAPAPTAPNTGSSSDGEISANVIKVAVVTIASLAAVAGTGVIVKRFLFSPLKRQRRK